MKRKLVIGILFMLNIFPHGERALGAGPGDTMKLTLDDAIATAMENNRDILIALQERDKAAQQVREAKSRAFPELNYSANYTRTLVKPVIFFEVGGEVMKFSPGFTNSLMSTISVNQTLYEGGKTWTAIEIAGLYSDSFEEQLKKTRKDVKLRVRQQFLGVLLSSEVLKINRTSLELAQAHSENAQKMFNAGMASEFDLLRAQVQVANALPKVISAENSLVLQENLLKNLIGIPLDREIEVQGDLVAELLPGEVIVEDSEGAYQNRNDYKNLDLLRDVYQENIKIERAGWFPRITASYNYQFQGQSNTWDFDRRYSTQNAGINFSIPLFDGFQTSSRVQLAKINLKEMDYQLLKLRESIEVQITQARNAMEEARKRLESLEKTVEQAQRAFDIATVRYQSGQGTQLEVFDARVAFEVAQLNKMQSIYDYEIAKAEWQNAIGR